MKCGHFIQVSAVDRMNGKDEPFEPNYMGTEQPSKYCNGDHRAISQEQVHSVAGTQHQLK